jgi:hypothetical protein
MKNSNASSRVGSKSLRSKKADEWVCRERGCAAPAVYESTNIFEFVEFDASLKIPSRYCEEHVKSVPRGFEEKFIKLDCVIIDEELDEENPQTTVG